MKMKWPGYSLIAMLVAFSFAACAKGTAGEEKGKEEAVPELDEASALVVKTPYFTLKLYGFTPAEEGTPEGYEGMVTDRSDIVEDLTINYELWDYLGMYGSPFNKPLRIVPGDMDFTVLKIDQLYSTTLFANMEGTGATWPMDKVEISTSEWAEIEKTGEYTYRTLTQKELDRKKAPISEESYKSADEQCKDARPPMEYSEFTLNARVRLAWTAPEEDTLTIILNFDYLYGD